MRKSHVYIGLFAVVLLLVGSGCEESDMQTTAEVLGGSQGVTAVDVIKHGMTGSSGDKEADTLIETADTMDNVRKANDLQDEATEAVNGKTPDYAKALDDLEQAKKLRPRDQTIDYQATAIRAERNDGEEIKPLVSPYAWCNVSSYEGDTQPAANKRCFRSMIKDRGKYLEESIVRQKQRGNLVSCATYKVVFENYDWVARMAPSDAVRLGMSLDDYDRYLASWEQAKAIIAHPGQSCANVKPLP
jgi:hypothetical protein